MSVLEIVLAVLLVGASGLFVWAMVGRQRLAAEAAASRVERDRHAEESARAGVRLTEEVEARARDVAGLREELETRREEAGGLRVEVGQLREQIEAEKRLLADRERAHETRRKEDEARLAKLEERFREAFSHVAGETLDASTKRFLELATERFERARKDGDAALEKRKEEVERLVKPIGETLEKTRERLDRIEEARTESFAKLSQQIDFISVSNAELRTETGKLVRALSRPEVRGRYGEFQLRRVAELAGMVAYCDFTEQSSTRDSEGNLLRPDMLVRLPNERVVAVDAKTNVDAYLEALNAETDDEREAQLDRFARHVDEQITKLSRKSYWSEYEGSPEFVVMFIPGDHFLDAALRRRPNLLERAADQHVILASPATLIGLLRAVAVGWREHKLAEDARALFELGRELHERAAVAMDHASDLGKAIRKSVDTYNRLVGSLDSRLMPTLRKFEDAGVKSSKALEDVPVVSVAPRALEAARDPGPPDGAGEGTGS